MSVVLRAVRKLAGVPVVRRLTKIPPLLRISYALRSSLVQERLRFVRNELGPGQRRATYRLRESNVAVVIRHQTGDVMVLDEIFSQREYEPPAEIDLGSVERAVDLGANIGLFGAWLLGRCPNAAIVAFEADPANATVHRLAIQANGLEARWRLVEAFAGVREGTTTFAAGLHAVSHEGGEIEVPVVDVLPELAGPEFLKIDIEGAEWPILADPRFRELPARIVALEYHAEGSPGADPADEAARLLADAGYEVHHTGRKPAFGAGLVWGIRL